MKHWFTNIIAGILVAVCFTSCDDDYQIANAPPARDKVIRVPSEAPTLQIALDSSRAGDTILIAPGVYSGAGNRDLVLDGDRIVIRSESGPATTIIDVGAGVDEQHFGFLAANVDSGTVFSGLTIRRAYANQGAAIDCHASDLIIQNCVFDSNTSTVAGGAIRCKGSQPLITGCTFVNNTSPFGGAIHLMGNSTPRIMYSLFVGNSGGAIMMNGMNDTPTVTCSNIFGNTGGDWSSYMAGQMMQHNNQSVDPQFCAPGNYQLDNNSPCAPANNACGQQIGALGIGCN